MSAPAGQHNRPGAVVKERKVRGVPISEARIEVLRAELLRALDTIDDLRDTVRLHNAMWSQTSAGEASTAYGKVRQ